MPVALRQQAKRRIERLPAIALSLAALVDQKTTQPATAIRFVDRPHEKTDDLAVRIDGERLPSLIIRAECQIIGWFGDELPLCFRHLETGDRTPVLAGDRLQRHVLAAGAG